MPLSTADCSITKHEHDVCSPIPLGTQKYADFLDACVAITGRAPRAGCHADVERQPQIILAAPDLDAGKSERAHQVLIASNRQLYCAMFGCIVWGSDYLWTKCSQKRVRSRGEAKWMMPSIRPLAISAG